MENELIIKIRPSFKKFLEVVQKSENEFGKFLPEVRDQRRKEVRLGAQSELTNAIDRFTKEIESDVAKLKQQIFQKMFPKRSKIHLDIDSISASGDRQLSLVYDLLNYSRNAEQILYQLKDFIEVKEIDAAFHLYKHLLMTYNPLKADNKQKEMMAEVESIIGKLKVELGISELEVQLNLRNQFLNNLRFFLSVLIENIDLAGTHIREINTLAKSFLKQIFPELYDYLFSKSYKKVEA